jgi:hypothetical protein
MRFPRFHVEPQGPTHSTTPESGAYDGQRPMIIMKTDPTHPPEGRQQWPGPTPPLNTSSRMEPPQPNDWPAAIGTDQVVLVPGPIMKRFS